ncbi:hypothetical protein LSH36_171g01025 [Paralvinella palmiformis]|uniref:PKD domain-containing protein n=1 Tax=Paralvinella palmiformis TaxID=53620 RepID=A0AAD9N6A6_9ANNE|nr:hypothetical protein LSH36_171g01025 [Paralvinella palmiformis]
MRLTSLTKVELWLLCLRVWLIARISYTIPTMRDRRGKTSSYKNDSMRVDAVLNDPGAATRTVVIFGHDERQKGWVVVMVDFQDILHRQCKNEDYVDWYPRDQIKGHQCLLGQKMTYKRRKPDAECFKGLSNVKAVSVKPCSCIMDDYECDYGYEIQNNVCKPAKWFDPNKPIGDCPEGGFYNKSKGYRKVAADKCFNETENLKPVLTKCPKMKAEGLHIILVGRHVIPLKTPVSFSLVQERGSKQSTSYSWNFGDDHVLTTFVGFEKAKNQTHIYQNRGLFIVTVKASNEDGSTEVSLTVLVEDKIKGLVVEMPHGAQANKPVLFEVSVSDDRSMFFRSKPGVHFMWRFGDEANEKDQQLTWLTSVTHTYKEPGNYSVFVEATNGGDTLFQIISVPVYGTLTTVQLTFDAVVDQMNDGTLLWNRLFAKVLKEALTRQFSIDYTRIEVVVLKDTTRTIADVSVLPVKQDLTKDGTIHGIVNKLLKLSKVNFSIALSRDEFQMSYNAKVTSAHIITAADEDNTKNYIAVYVCVPILVAAIFVSMLVVLYYKKTFSSANRRYRLLRNQADGPEPDSLLDDTDDDDLPLDLNADDSNRRLALSDDERLLQADRRNVEA